MNSPLPELRMIFKQLEKAEEEIKEILVVHAKLLNELSTGLLAHQEAILSLGEENEAQTQSIQLMNTQLELLSKKINDA